MSKAKIYSTPTCPFCEQGKQFMRKNDIEFDDINVAVDQQSYQEMITKSGFMGVPVFEIEGEFFLGFDDKVQESLLKHKG